MGIAQHRKVTAAGQAMAGEMSVCICVCVYNTMRGVCTTWWLGRGVRLAKSLRF